MFTIVILSFHSRHLIIKFVENIDSSIPIIIIENSCDINLKNELEGKYKNAKLLKRVPVSKVLRNKLIDELKPGIVQLEDILDIELKHWKLP